MHDQIAHAGPTPGARPRSALLLEWPPLVSLGRLFAAAILVSFIVAVWLGVRVPAAGDMISRAIRQFHSASYSLVDRILPAPFLVILAGNLKAALTAALRGSAAAFALGAVLGREQASGRARDYGWAGRVSYHLLALCVAAGRRAFREVREIPDLSGQAAAALASLIPPATVVVNGSVLGLYLAAGILQGWMPGLGVALRGLLPHGLLEIPALLLSAALGALLARDLARQLRTGSADLRSAVRRCLRRRPVALTSAFIVAIIITGALFEAATLA